MMQDGGVSIDKVVRRNVDMNTLTEIAVIQSASNVKVC